MSSSTAIELLKNRHVSTEKQVQKFLVVRRFEAELLEHNFDFEEILKASRG